MSRRSLDLLHRTLTEKSEVQDAGGLTPNLQFYRNIDGKIIIDNALDSFVGAIKLDFRLFDSFKAN